MRTIIRARRTAIKSLLALLVLFGLQGANADAPKRLTAAEIETLLAGNTAVGLWDGKPYRQFFSSSGSTIYAQPGTRSSLGRWRVDRRKNLYESWWENSDWSGYAIDRDDGKLFWITLSGVLPPQEFEMVAGEKLLFE